MGVRSITASLLKNNFNWRDFCLKFILEFIWFCLNHLYFTLYYNEFDPLNKKKCKSVQLIVDGVKIKKKWRKCYFVNKMSEMIYNIRWNFAVPFLDMYRKCLISDIWKVIFKLVSVHMEPQIDEFQTSSYSLVMPINKKRKSIIIK